MYDIALQNKPKLSKWQKKTFPHYDVMMYLVDGIIATGAGAFNPGETPSSSPARKTDANTSRSTTPDVFADKSSQETGERGAVSSDVTLSAASQESQVCCAASSLELWF